MNRTSKKTYYLLLLLSIGILLQSNDSHAQQSFRVDSLSWEKQVQKCDFSKELESEDDTTEDDEFTKTPERKSFNFDGLSASFQIFAWVFIGLLIILLIYFLIQSGAFKRNRAIKTKGEWLEKIEQIEEDLENKDLRYFIKQALKEEAYNVAIRLQYLLAIQQLNESEKISWKKQKTNGEYQTELKGSPYFIDFKKATLSFEYVWYSNTDFTASSLLQYYKSIEANVNSILKGLKQENDG